MRFAQRELVSFDIKDLNHRDNIHRVGVRQRIVDIRFHPLGSECELADCIHLSLVHVVHLQLSKNESVFFWIEFDGEKKSACHFRKCCESTGMKAFYMIEISLSIWQ